MDEPKIAGTSPTQCDLEAGKNYAWCTCGLSENQPFCDGKHKGTSFVPNVFQVDEAKSCHLCNCKRTANGPYCDGAHNNLDG